MNNEKNKALIVDDVEINSIILAHMLEVYNIDSVAVSSSNEFFNVIQEKKIEIIFMDIDLGEELSGIDLIKYLNENNYTIPVVIQTAYNVNDIQFKDIKFDGFMNKPYDPVTLTLILNKIYNK